MKYVMILIMILLVGCTPNIVMHPDASMLIQDTGWRGAKVAIYSKTENKMIEYGWVKVPVGYTLHKYDWEKYIKEHQ